jgi:hypothetical protein
LQNLDELRLGTVTLDRLEPVVGGSVGQWTCVLTVGSYGIDERGTIKISQRLLSDWEVPQFDRPDQPAYTTVHTNGDAKLAVRFDTKAYERPWQRCIVIDVYDGCLAPGDKVTIVLGDRSKGSVGIRAQTFQEREHEFRFLVDPFGSGVFRRVPSSPLFPIIPGKPTRLVCIVPTQLTVGQGAEVFVKGEDKWGNPTPPPDGLSLSVEGSASAIKLDGRKIIGSAVGTACLRASSEGMTCRSNPVTVLPEKPRYSKFWGDLHAQSGSTVGTGTEEEYFTYGRDRAHLDFTCHQGNDFQMTDKDVKNLAAAVKKFHQDGRFVVFPGIEWSGNTPAGGDRNVIYLEDDQPVFRSSHWQIQEPETAQTPAHPASELFKRVREHGKSLTIAHVGGRYADIRRYMDEEVGPLVELVSCWGIFEWMLWDAFEKGYIVGVVCNSDGHKGRPGAEGPGAGEFGIAGGLTCVLTESLTRKDVFNALKNRRCYGTTGARMDLSFDASGHSMGECFSSNSTVTIRASAKAVATLEALELYEGPKVIQTVRAPEFASMKNSKRIRISWGGARIRGRGRRAKWDGSIRVQGARIEAARTFAFDSASDGITETGADHVSFKSQTTGDIDGIDLTLDQTSRGKISFESPTGSCSIDLAELGNDPRRFDFGGLGLHTAFQRYPEKLTATELSFEFRVEPKAGKPTPYFMKAIQEDGQLGWTSPVYVTRDA